MELDSALKSVQCWSVQFKNCEWVQFLYKAALERTVMSSLTWTWLVISQNVHTNI